MAPSKVAKIWLSSHDLDLHSMTFLVFRKRKKPRDERDRSIWFTELVGIDYVRVTVRYRTNNKGCVNVDNFEIGKYENEKALGLYEWVAIVYEAMLRIRRMVVAAVLRQRLWVRYRKIVNDLDVRNYEFIPRRDAWRLKRKRVITGKNFDYAWDKIMLICACYIQHDIAEILDDTRFEPRRHGIVIETLRFAELTQKSGQRLVADARLFARFRDAFARFNSEYRLRGSVIADQIDELERVINTRNAAINTLAELGFLHGHMERSTRKNHAVVPRSRGRNR